MELLPYNEFASLRMKEFWPPSAQIDWFTSYTTLLGYANCDGEVYRYAYFIRDTQAPDDLGGIALESLGPDSCPEGAAERLLARLHLPLSAGMSLDEVLARLGEPVERSVTEPDMATHLEFVVGRDWPYHVFCSVWPGRGLQYIAVLRKDLYDRKTAIESAEQTRE